MTGTAQPATTPAPGRGRPLVVWGVVLIAVGLVLGVTAAAFVVSRVVGGVAEAFTGPTYRTPVRVQLNADRATYVVYELTGTRNGSGPVPVGSGGPTTITPDDVRVTAPDGAPVAVAFVSGDQVVTRDSAIYTGAVEFDANQPGQYVVDISASGSEVVVARSFGSALRGVGRWVAGIPVGALLVLLGLVLLIVGLTQRSRDRRAAGVGARPGAYPYQAPAAPHQPAAAPYQPPSAAPYQPPSAVPYQPPSAAPYQAPTAPYQAPTAPYEAPTAPPPAAALPPPGWYPDPADPTRTRYWDGRSWTGYSG